MDQCAHVATGLLIFSLIAIPLNICLESSFDVGGGLSVDGGGLNETINQQFVGHLVVMFNDSS